MRTQKEIVEQIKKAMKYDLLGFEIDVLISYLDYEHAKEFLKEVPEEQEALRKKEWIVETKSAKEAMKEYMPFAWEKANNFRGISAMRSMLHYKAWLFIEGEDALSAEMKDYKFYGKPQLIKVCKYLGLDSEQWDDHVRKNSED